MFLNMFWLKSDYDTVFFLIFVTFYASFIAQSTIVHFSQVLLVLG